jgi:hypothetical protein
MFVDSHAVAVRREDSPLSEADRLRCLIDELRQIRDHAALLVAAAESEMTRKVRLLAELTPAAGDSLP